jgi:hypothetical protein
MAAFCHFGFQGSRFSDGSFGVYYCARQEGTAIAETRFHAERFMRESSQPAMLLPQRVYLSQLAGTLIDVRYADDAGALLAPDDWQSSQAFGHRARRQQADGIVYPSVRQHGGECAAVLRPPVMSATRQGRHLGYQWDGVCIRHVLELSLVE